MGGFWEDHRRCWCPRKLENIREETKVMSFLNLPGAFPRAHHPAERSSLTVLVCVPDAAAGLAGRTHTRTHAHTHTHTHPHARTHTCTFHHSYTPNVSGPGKGKLRETDRQTRLAGGRRGRWPEQYVKARREEIG